MQDLKNIKKKMNLIKSINKYLEIYDVWKKKNVFFLLSSFSFIVFPNLIPVLNLRASFLSFPKLLKLSTAFASYKNYSAKFS